MPKKATKFAEPDYTQDVADIDRATSEGMGQQQWKAAQQHRPAKKSSSDGVLNRTNSTTGDKSPRVNVAKERLSESARQTVRTRSDG